MSEKCNLINVCAAAAAAAQLHASFMLFTDRGALAGEGILIIKAL